MAIDDEDDLIYVDENDDLDDMPENPVAKEEASESSSSSKSKEDSQSSSKKESKSSLNNAEEIKKIVEEQEEIDANIKEDKALLNKVYNVNNKEDSLELLILIEDLIYKLNLAAGRVRLENEKTDEYSKRLKDAETSLKEYILDMKRVGENTSETTRFLKDLLSSFQSDVEQMVQEIDLSPMQNGIMKNISDILSKMPINEVNHSVSTLKTLVESLIKSIGTYKDDATVFDDKLYAQRQEFAAIVQELKDSAQSIKEEKDKSTGKRFGWVTLVSVFVIGCTISTVGSVYLYQDFFGQKFDEIAKSIQSNGVNGIKVHQDSKGKFIVYNARTMKMQKTQKSGQFKIYIK